MKVKNKLHLGFGFLFIIVLLLGAISIFYINEVSNNAKLILKDNYTSLDFASEMRTVLDENKLPLDAKAISSFNNQLVKEEHNITEPGEMDAARGLRKAFNQLQNKSTALVQQEQAEKEAKRYLHSIERVNMRAIVQKSEKANTSVDRAIMFLGLAATFIFLVLFVFSINFPNIISGPLNTLLDGITEISEKNYTHRIKFDKNDEFAKVGQAFNNMAARLNELENSNLSNIMAEEFRIKTIIEQMDDAVIGVNEKQEILFVNTAAKKLFSLNEPGIKHKHISEIIKNNALFKAIIDDEKAGKPFKIVVDGKDTYFQLEAHEIRFPT